VNPFVVWIEDTESGSRHPCAFAQSPVRLGRSPRNDISLPRPFVSSFHGVIHFDGDGARYTDLASTNGSTVDGVPAEPRVSVPLETGSELRIGSLRLTFRPPPGSQAPRVPDPGTDVAVPPPVRRGGITALMLDLAQAPRAENDGEWRRVLFAGAVIGRFELVKEIGRGGFGLVFEAKDRELGRLVAFKAVKPGRFSQVRFRKEQLQREAEAIAQLSHPNIVQIYDVGRCESGPYLILELLRGQTLHARLRAGSLPLRQAIDVAIDVAWALEHAHAAGVVHRDLKPPNVFLCEGGRVKVLDFGIAHVFGDGEPRALGTPAYMAPEQWREGSQDTRTDVFGAAVMLFESVTGMLPYQVTPEWSSVLDDGARPAVEGAGLPPRLEALLLAALDPDPDVRPRDGAAWLEGLIAVQAAMEPAPSRAGRPGPVPIRRYRLAGLALLVAAACAIGWALLAR
jgi:hypothetical protein